MTSSKHLSPDLTRVKQELVRRSFWDYRRIIRPRMFIGWWQADLAARLQRFYQDLIAGRRPKLVIQAPPQHGKSEQVEDFIGWLVGMNPDTRVIYASFSDRLGVRANKNLQRRIDSDTYRELFPGTSINAENVVTKFDRPLRNSDVFEFVNREGYFRNTTVLGSVTGEGLDLGVVDDPLKGRAEASSKLVRDRTWDWFTDDFFSRFSERAGLLVIMTRWHLDDPVGRMIADLPGVEVVTYKAIATEDEEHRKAGDPLFPELKSMDFLTERQRLMLPARWSALYQQDPQPDEGSLMDASRLVVVDQLPADVEVTQEVRYWDKAGTEGAGCFTVGAKLGKLSDGRFAILDIIRDQVGAVRRERMIRQAADMDGSGVTVWIEQEPGSGGKESAENTILRLSGYVVKADKPTGNKELRAEPYAVQVEAGNILVLRRSWTEALIEEHRTFPGGKYKDQIDAVAGAFNKLARPSVAMW